MSGNLSLRESIQRVQQAIGDRGPELATQLFGIKFTGSSGEPHCKMSFT